jgi:hypothetical protein
MAAATAMAMGQWGDSDDQLIDCSGARATAMGQQQRQQQWHWHWGRANGGNGNGDCIAIVLDVVLQPKTSTLVVDENVQNVWTANIPDVLRWNKACMLCSGILLGVSENSSRKWS